MKILVCGCTGFMGKNITEFFIEKGDAVFGVTNINHYNEPPKGIILLSADLTTKEGISHVFSYGPYDIVIQAAAVTSGSKDIIEKPYLHVTDNAVMNSLILRACYENYVKHFIFLSCGVMYQSGEEPRREEDFNEHDIIFPAYFGVGWTKVYIEKMCEFYSRLGRTKHTVIRHSNSYGPYDKYDLERSHMFGASIKKIVDAKNGDTINVWGTGEETRRDLIYVKDVVNFIDIVLQKQTEVYDLVNIGYGYAFSVREVIETIMYALGKNLNIFYDTSKPVIPTSLTLDCSKANEKYGWRSRTHFLTGIRKTLEWYKDFYEIKE